MADLSARGRQALIRTPDQRLRVFVSSTLEELADERTAARAAITRLRLTPVMFELGARPHPPRHLYRAYLTQSHIFVGIYWQRYGWVAPDMDWSGLEDEYRLAGDTPKLIYLKSPAPEREPRLRGFLDRIKAENVASYQKFSTAEQLGELIENDLALLLTERFESTQAIGLAPGETPLRRPNNLPVPRNPLIGREREVAVARELLLRDEAGLVTLTGAGGTGKSRLALHVAREMLEHFRDGVFLVSLAPISDPTLVASAIAETLDVRETPGGQPLVESLKDYLRDRQILLLLDNFEHVVAAAPLVGQLLGACPKLKVLTTSRARLRVSGEKELPVPPLALPDPKHGPDVERISKYPAVELFIQRAMAVTPEFTLTRENAAAVAEICHRLDGLPLAIELAAARIKILGPQALLARLDSRLDLLRGGARDLPDRQHTLRSAIDWSYDLLDQKVKTLFRRLSVFAGGATLEEAEAVCNADADVGPDVLDALEALVDNSLLTPSAGGNSELRFEMLETIREYALERLAASQVGEADTMRRRHAEFFLGLAREAEHYMTGRERGPWLARLDIEHDNFRSALAWSTAENGEADTGLGLAVALGWFWYFRGHLSEGRGWLNGALTQTAPSRSRARLEALYSAGGLAWAQGDWAAARVQLDESIAIARELGDTQGLARALYYLGLVHTGGGNPEAARLAHQESLDLLRGMDDPWREAFTLRGLGDATLMAGDSVAAQRIYEKGLAIFRSLDDSWGMSLLLRPLGEMAVLRGDYAAARSLCDESVGIAREAGDRWSLGQALLGLGHVALHQGNPQQAREVFEESLGLWRDLGYPGGVLKCLIGFAGVALTQGPQDARIQDPRRRARLLGAVAALSQAAGFSLDPLSRAEFDRYSAAVSARLDDAAFREAWTEGQRLTLEQAVADALTGARP